MHSSSRENPESLLPALLSSSYHPSESTSPPHTLRTSSPAMPPCLCASLVLAIRGESGQRPGHVRCTRLVWQDGGVAVTWVSVPHEWVSPPQALTRCAVHGDAACRQSCWLAKQCRTKGRRRAGSRRHPGHVHRPGVVERPHRRRDRHRPAAGRRHQLQPVQRRPGRPLLRVPGAVSAHGHGVKRLGNGLRRCGALGLLLSTMWLTFMGIHKTS